MPGNVAFSEVHRFLKSRGWSLEQVRESQALFSKKGVGELVIEFHDGQVNQVDFETIQAILDEEASDSPFGFGPRGS
jgi:hypothetical protein